jgi:hypothetical protein
MHLKIDPEIELSVAAAPDKESSTHSSAGIKANAFLQGAGFAALFIASTASDFLTSSLGEAYHRVQPLVTIFRAVLIALFLLWLVVWIGFAVCEALPPRWKRVAWLVPLVFLPWLICRDLSAVFVLPRVADAGFAAMPWAPPIGIIVFLPLLMLRPRLFDWCVAGARFAYIVGAFSLLVILPKVVIHAMSFGAHEQSSFARSGLPVASPSASRIVWILMDEFSYDQGFDHRQPDVTLPNFDAFARSSVAFSAVQPVGKMTEEVLPALLLGKQIVDFKKPYGALPSYRTSAGGPWQRFNQHDTIFGDAHRLDWSTGIAGWYNPYCRLLPDVLDRCFWQYSEDARTTYSRFLDSGSTTMRNLAVIFSFPPFLYRALHIPPLDYTPAHRQDYADLMIQSKHLLHDSRIRFVLLHLPVPHPPGLYDRARKTMSDHGSYLDNLVLADFTLGVLLRDIQSTPAMKNTTVIVSSDHSWRTFIWKPMHVWSPEDERASGGRFDPRPVLMVHLPGSTTAQTIARPTSELIVHTMLEAMLRNQIHSDADIAALPPGAPVAGRGEMGEKK